VVPLRGFFPLTASGLLLLLLSLSLSLQAARMHHLRSSLYLQETALQELVLAGVNAKNDLRDLCRYATYRALREVGLHASSYRNDGERVEAVENLARDLFSSQLPLLPALYSEADPRLLLLPGEGVRFHLSPAENGFCLLRVKMPGAELLVSSHDGSTRLRFPLEELEAFIDSRFFLLQERMNLFLGRLGKIEEEWRNAQYLSAWAQALSLRRVELSPSFAEGSLLTAWASEELRTFGSFDYSYPLRQVLPPLSQRREEVLRLLKGMEEKAGVLCRKGENGKEGLGALEEDCERLGSLVEGSGDPLVESLSDSFLPRLRSSLSGVSSENGGDALSSLRLLLQGAVEEFGRLVGPSGPYPEILPPPVRKEPGLSVLRELRVREVRFRREDPSGLLGLSSATPLFLPYLGVRVWWAEWKTELLLEREPVEEISDFSYPTLLLPGLSSRFPLSYRFMIPRLKFETRVVVFSPWPFSVSS
jgi:hypothetical protein